MPLVGIGTLPTPFSPASVPLPQETGGRGHTSLRVGGWGESQFRRGAYTVVLFICTYFVLFWKQIILSNPDPQVPCKDPDPSNKNLKIKKNLDFWDFLITSYVWIPPVSNKQENLGKKDPDPESIDTDPLIRMRIKMSQFRNSCSKTFSWLSRFSRFLTVRFSDLLKTF